MSERSGISFFFMILLGILAFATHGCKHTIYEEREYEVDTKQAAEQKLASYVTNNLIPQWKAKTLPQEEVGAHLDKIYQSFVQEKSFRTRKVEVGKTPAPTVFYFFAGSAGLAALFFISYSFFDSRWYKGAYEYWTFRREAYKGFMKKEIDLLEQMRKTQRAIEKS